MSRPGSVVTNTINHPLFDVNGEQYFVQELHWNGISGRSYDLVRHRDDAVMTEDESFDDYPTEEQIAAVLEDHGIDAEMETCKMCWKAILLDTAHRHDNGWVGACCWDERLRMTS
ncbi:hypothetical protein [Streptomyces sp. NPDC101455]|uniref:hypothetical protein n=1 Tax=Streptomyces sp. NPDC101455 TaxID=3366142 RepID=UPI0037FC9713